MRAHHGGGWASGKRRHGVPEILDVEVSVGAERGVDARVPEDALHAVGVHLGSEEKGRDRVAVMPRSA